MTIFVRGLLKLWYRVTYRVYPDRVAVGLRTVFAHPHAVQNNCTTCTTFQIFNRNLYTARHDKTITYQA